jgi:MFS family permease
MSVTSTALPSRLRRRRGSHPGVAVLAVASVTQFVVVLDVTITDVALPPMRAALHISTAGEQWVVNAYVLTFAGFPMPRLRTPALIAGIVSIASGIRALFLGGVQLPPATPTPRRAT